MLSLFVLAGMAVAGRYVHQVLKRELQLDLVEVAQVVLADQRKKARMKIRAQYGFATPAKLRGK